MLDKIALNLLYIQTSSDVDRGWILTTNEVKDQLDALQSNGNKKEVCLVWALGVRWNRIEIFGHFQYLEIAKGLPSYGCIKFSNAIVDYPNANENA